MGFVKQHRMTCVPATLSAISRFWSKAADHVQVADEICYNGTTAYHERQWACRNGWIAREFTVTEESTQAILKRGVPFTLNTVEPGAGHLQAVIGYDGRRGTLLIRDPSCGFPAKPWPTRSCIAIGPLAPAAWPWRRRKKPRGWRGLPCPTRRYGTGCTPSTGPCVRHCRDEARQILEIFPPRPRAIASPATPGCGWRSTMPTRPNGWRPSSRSLEIAGDDPCLQLDRLGCLRGLSKRGGAAGDFREPLCPAGRPHPIFLQQYADELRIRRPAAAGGRAAWRNGHCGLSPMEAGNYFVLASIYWDQRRFAEALELYRFAACLNDKEENFAHSYFVAAQWFKKTEESLQFLRARFERFGAKSWMPARTLVTALLHLNRSGEAIETIEKALALRPRRRRNGPLRRQDLFVVRRDPFRPGSGPA